MTAVEIEQGIFDIPEQGSGAFKDRSARTWDRRQVRRQPNAGNRARSAEKTQLGIAHGIASIDQVLRDGFDPAQFNYNGLGDQSIRVLQSLGNALLRPTS